MLIFYYLQNNVSSAPSSPPTSTPMAVTSTVPPGARSSSPYSSSASGQQQNTRCCETGRTVHMDEATGLRICSCQVERLNYHLANAASMAGAGPGGMPLQMYSHYGEPLPYFPGVGNEQLAFYQNAVSF